MLKLRMKRIKIYKWARRDFLYLFPLTLFVRFIWKKGHSNPRHPGYKLAECRGNLFLNAAICSLQSVSLASLALATKSQVLYQTELRAHSQLLNLDFIL